MAVPKPRPLSSTSTTEHNVGKLVVGRIKWRKSDDKLPGHRHDHGIRSTVEWLFFCNTLERRQPIRWWGGLYLWWAAGTGEGVDSIIDAIRVGIRSVSCPRYGDQVAN